MTVEFVVVLVVCLTGYYGVLAVRIMEGDTPRVPGVMECLPLLVTVAAGLLWRVMWTG